jgi:hypothetical protein
MVRVAAAKERAHRDKLGTIHRVAAKGGLGIDWKISGIDISTVNSLRVGSPHEEMP